MKVKKYSNLQIDNGKLSNCYILASIKIFNKKFPNYAIPVLETDYLDIHKISSLEEIILYLKQDKDLCKYCHYGHDEKSAPWKLSNFEASEWYNV